MHAPDALRRSDEPMHLLTSLMAADGTGVGGTPLPEQRAGGEPRGRGELILVVDDDPAVLRMASKVLRRGGYQVLEAGGGPEALQIAEQHEGKIEILLTDVVMPEMGGREVSEALRARYPHIRVLFMSAYTEDEVILRGVRVAEVNFVSKPFTVDGLRRKVREVLDGPGD